MEDRQGDIPGTPKFLSECATRPTLSHSDTVSIISSRICLRDMSLAYHASRRVHEQASKLHIASRDNSGNLCLYNQLFALFHYVFKFLTP